MKDTDKKADKHQAVARPTRETLEDLHRWMRGNEPNAGNAEIRKADVKDGSCKKNLLAREKLNYTNYQSYTYYESTHNVEVLDFWVTTGFSEH